MPKRISAYQQESELESILTELWRHVGGEHYLLEHHPVGDWDRRAPISFIYREGPWMLLVNGEPEFDPVSLTAIKLFTQKGMGVEGKGGLGPVLSSMRSEAWWDLASNAWHEEHEPEDYRLLRTGVNGSQKSIYDAVVVLAHRYFPVELRRLDAQQAVDEVLVWARRAGSLRHGEVIAVRELLVGIYNSLLSPVEPYEGLIGLVKKAFPFENDTWTQKRTKEIRVGVLRLFTRLEAQADAWDSNVVTLPTSWFKDRKDPCDHRSLVGVSAKSYQKVLDHLMEAKILRQVSHGRPGRGASTYLLDLGIEDDDIGSLVPLGEAERLLRG